MVEVIGWRVIVPALIGTVIVCTYLAPAGIALRWRRWFSGVVLLIVLAVGLVALPVAPVVTGGVWLCSMLGALLVAKDAKRDFQHRELKAAIQRAADAARVA
jgi:hypothetical protein